MRYLTLGEVVRLHQQILADTGGADGLRDLGALESALSQPKLSAGGAEAYASLVDKAAALAFSLCSNHAFVDGNKRIAHAAMEVFLILNGAELHASVDEQERVMLQLAAGELSRSELTQWLANHTRTVFLWNMSKIAVRQQRTCNQCEQRTVSSVKPFASARAAPADSRHCRRRYAAA